MDMGMKDFLSRGLAIIDPQIETYRAHGGLHFSRHNGRCLKKLPDRFVWHLTERGIMLAGNDQRMPRGAGEDIEEGDYPFPLKNLLSRSLALSNLAKEASAHSTLRRPPR